MADRMMTSSNTSRDPERWGRDPNILKARYFENGSRQTRLQWGRYRKWHTCNWLVTWPMTSC